MAHKYYLAPQPTGDTRYVNPPPGLLLSLGDGTAVEVTAEMVAKALWPVSWEDANTRTRTHIERRASDLLAALIQQAQEARDASV